MNSVNFDNWNMHRNNTGVCNVNIHLRIASARKKTAPEGAAPEALGLAPRAIRTRGCIPR
jgi:hypothetical protein